MLTTNLHVQELLHKEHLASMQQAVQEARRLRQMEGQVSHDGEARRTARLLLQLSGTLALLLTLLRRG
jgi:hypothetical protein